MPLRTAVAALILLLAAEAEVRSVLAPAAATAAAIEEQVDPEDGLDVASAALIAAAAEQEQKQP